MDIVSEKDGKAKKEILQEKRDLFTALLLEFPTDRELTLEETVRKDKIQNKLNRIEYWLNNWDQGESPRCGRGYGRKRCGKAEKGEKGMRKLSPEAVEEIMALKGKIGMLKPNLEDLKGNIRAKKQMIHKAQDRETVCQLRREICGLKQEMILQRQQLCPLKLRIRYLKLSQPN